MWPRRQNSKPVICQTRLIKVFVTWPGLSSLTHSVPWFYFSLSWPAWIFIFPLSYSMTILLLSSLESEVFPGSVSQGCKFSVHLSSQPNTRKPSGTRSLKVVLLYTSLHRHLAVLHYHCSCLTLCFKILGWMFTLFQKKQNVCIFFFYPGVHSPISHCDTAFSL